MEEFIEKLGPLIGENMSKKEVGQLFMKIDADSNGGVDWYARVHRLLPSAKCSSSLHSYSTAFILNRLHCIPKEQAALGVCDASSFGMKLPMPCHAQSDSS